MYHLGSSTIHFQSSVAAVSVHVFQLFSDQTKKTEFQIRTFNVLILSQY